MQDSSCNYCHTVDQGLVSLNNQMKKKKYFQLLMMIKRIEVEEKNVCLENCWHVGANYIFGSNINTENHQLIVLVVSEKV